MKRLMGWIVGLSALAVIFAGAAQAQKPHHGHEALCPMHIDGAQVQVSNTADGVTITVTAKDPATVKEIQAAAATHAAMKKAGCPCCADKGHKVTAQPAGKKHAAQEVWVCPMGCYEGPKTADGRCPKCGMDLKKK